MAKDVIITPASGKLDFYATTGGSVLANINLTDNNDLSLSTTSGNLIIGDASRDVYIGDGTNEVDIVFEQNGEIRSVAGKYITVNAGTVNATGVAVNTSSPTAVMHVYGSTPSGTVFNVEGTNGSLFSVVDNLSGTLMSVNNNAGLPVLEVFSDDKIVGGRFGQNDFVISSSGNVGIGLANPSTKLEVSGTITATTLVKSGGTSSQFLKADGTVDSSTYVTSLSHNHGIADSAGTQQFTFGINDNIRIAGGGATSIAFDSNTKKITISSTDTNTTYSASNGVTLTGTTFSHTDTSSQGSVDNSNGTVIQDVTLDTYGHVTGLGSVDLDSRYYTETEVDSNFARRIYVTRTVPTTVNNYVNIGDFSVTNGAINIDIGISVSDGGFSVAKRYLIASNYNETTSTWKLVAPISDGGIYTSNNFILEANHSGAALSLRIVRTSGSTTGTAKITMFVLGASSVADCSFNASTATGTTTPATDYYPSALLSMVDGVAYASGNRILTTVDGGTFYLASNPNGYTTNTGTVTGIGAGSGMNFTFITGTGSVTLGTPSNITLSSTNSLSANSHTHAFVPGGTTAQYIRGDGTLTTFPTIPTVNDATLTLNVSGTGLSGSQTFTANQSSNATFTVTSNATSANTASTIVARDASGNFSAGAITAGSFVKTLGVGESSTDLLQAGGGVVTPGSLSVSYAGTAGSANQVANTLTRGSYLTGNNFNGSSATTWAVDAATANTASKIVARDASGNFSAGTITAALNGNANTVTNGVYTIGDQSIGGAKTFTSQIINTTANNTTNGGGQIYLNGTNGNRIDFNQNGTAAPAFTTRSAGTKITLFPNVGASSADYAIGIESSTLWNSVPTTSQQFKWYAGTTNIATLTGAGVLTVAGSTSQINVDNLRLDGNTLSSTNTNGDLIIAPQSASAKLLTSTTGNTRGTGANDLQRYRLNNTQVAAGAYSVIGGGAHNTASGGASVILGGTLNTASSTYCSVGGGYYNIAGGNLATIGGGSRNEASTTLATIAGGGSFPSAYYAGNRVYSDWSTIGGGGGYYYAGNVIYSSSRGSTISGGMRISIDSAPYSSIGGGFQNKIYGSFSKRSIGGGYRNISSGGEGSIIPGGIAAKTTRYGELSHAAGLFSTEGDAQHSIFVLRGKTISAAQTTTLGLSGVTTSRLTVENGEILSGTIEILGSISTGASVARYKRQFTIKNVGGTTSLVGSIITLGTDEAAGTTISITADNTNDALSISVTRAASETWRWVAVVDCISLRYGA